MSTGLRFEVLPALTVARWGRERRVTGFEGKRTCSLIQGRTGQNALTMTTVTPAGCLVSLFQDDFEECIHYCGQDTFIKCFIHVTGTERTTNLVC